MPPLVTGLQMPFRELMPTLTTDADELAEARSRLLPGEDVDEDCSGGWPRCCGRCCARPARRGPRSSVLLVEGTGGGRGRRGSRPRSGPGAARPPDLAAGARFRAVRRRPGAGAGPVLRVPDQRDLSRATTCVDRRTTASPRCRPGTLSPGRLLRSAVSATAAAAARGRRPRPRAPPTTGSSGSPGAASRSTRRASRSGSPRARRLEPRRRLRRPRSSAVVLELAPRSRPGVRARARDGPFVDDRPGASRPAAAAHLRRPRSSSGCVARFPARPSALPGRRRRQDRGVGGAAAHHARRHAAARRAVRAAVGRTCSSRARRPCDPMPRRPRSPPRHALGFTVTWRPAPAFGVTGWPADARRARHRSTPRSSRSSAATSRPATG